MDIKPILLLFLLSAVIALPEADQVTQLKGYYDFSKEFAMYSGYLTLQDTPRIASHYLFITSKDKPDTDDLVLWLNGGPGCSSMLGFIQEFGPHVLKQGAQTLEPHPNNAAWNAHANLLFIESPPGVGFSINQDPAYNQYNDSRTAQDNLNALKAFFKKFPEFGGHRFWISGESYAGMYLPELADLILKNKDSIVEGKTLDFKGMMIGNGAMDMDLYWRTKVPVSYFDSHYYMGPEVQALVKTCRFDASDDHNPSCQMGLKLTDQATARINGYNPIGICYNPPQSNKAHRRGYRYTPFYRYASEEPDCDTDDSGMIAYFNDPEVQKQLHVDPTEWSPCSDKIWDLYTFGTTTIPLFDSFKEAGLKMMFYSGNVDAVVPLLETQEYVKRIGWAVSEPAKVLMNPRGSLEGWLTKYQNNLSLYVINAAGHMVPCEKPYAALRMFQGFILGKF